MMIWHIYRIPFPEKIKTDKPSLSVCLTPVLGVGHALSLFQVGLGGESCIYLAHLTAQGQLVLFHGEKVSSWGWTDREEQTVSVQILFASEISVTVDVFCPLLSTPKIN